MAQPTTREEFKNYCLRRLGEPLLQVNITPDQLEERVDDALNFFQNYHFDGTEKVYLRKAVTASSLSFGSAITGTFTPGEFIQGTDDVTKGYFLDVATNGLSLRFKSYGNDSFEVGEVVTGLVSGATGTITSVVSGDLDNKYISLSEDVLSVISIFKPSGNYFGASTIDGGLFDPWRQQVLSDFHRFGTFDVASWSVFNNYMSTVNDYLHPPVPLRFNRRQNRVYIDFNWGSDITYDQYVIIECWVALDPETYPEVWKDQFLIDYACALIKRQWGWNLTKLQNISLLGSVTLNAGQIYSEAVAEVEKLEERARNEFSEPADIFIG